MKRIIDGKRYDTATATKVADASPNGFYHGDFRGVTDMLKCGTRIELHATPAFPGFPGVAPEQATIARWTTISGPRMEGWHIVRFAHGGMLCVHETRFRVVDNR